MKAFGVLFTVVEHDDAPWLGVPRQLRQCAFFEAFGTLGIVIGVVPAQNIPHDDRTVFFQCERLKRRQPSVVRSKHDRFSSMV